MLALSLVRYGISGVLKVRKAAQWPTTRKQLSTRTQILEIQYKSTFELLLVGLGTSRFMALNLANEFTDKDPWELLFPGRASVMLGQESALFPAVVELITVLIRQLKEAVESNHDVRPSNELRPSY
jgi:hypothetical protein